MSAFIGYLIQNPKFGLLGFVQGALNQFLENALTNALCCDAKKDSKQGNPG